MSKFYLINDGLGVDLASKILYKYKFIENLNGTDLIPWLLYNFKRNIKVYLYGGTLDSVSKTKIHLEKRYAHVSVVGFIDGFLSQKLYKNLIKDMNASDADVLLVAKGNPLQEEWIYEYSKEITIPILIGVGALFDILSGNVVRAPNVMQTFRIEWLFRLFNEPYRMWKRYLIGNFIFIFNVLKQKLSLYENPCDRSNKSHPIKNS